MSAAAPIAVAVDGSAASRAALDYAATRARREGRGLTGVFVLDAGWADYIGNDWQSSRNARQGFLDYVLAEQEAQAQAARAQFEAGTAGLANARFAVLAGDPLDELCGLMERGEATLLVAGRDVFQVCGRPSLKRLARDLRRRVGQALVIA